MGKEIERKYLVIDNAYRALSKSAYHIVQGYLSARKEATVRIRIIDEKAFLTIKSANVGIERCEWEYSVPIDDARLMLAKCQPQGVIDKTRYIVDYNGAQWEIDEFHGELSPLVIAEIELSDADDTIALPPFVGREVSNDPRYYNSSLANAGLPKDYINQ